MRQFQRTALSLAAAQAALLWSGLAMAQTAPAPAASAPTDSLSTVVITGQRAALISAQKIKQNSDEIVDSIVADDIGKLPDRSVTEVLQRIVGVTIDRTMAKGDPEHFSVEGSGVTIRGLTYVRSELNGRDSFSANGGRSLNFEDVPPELMAGVDVYKNPSAEQIEGAIGGLVNLRTAMPLDYKGFKAAVSLQETDATLARKTKPSASLLLSDSWDTDLGRFGALLDLAHSDSSVRTDAFQVEPYYPRTDVNPGSTVWIPKGAAWRTLEFDRKRAGTYAALQWRKNDIESSVTYFKSKYKMTWNEDAIFAQSSPYNITVDPGATYGSNGALLTGTLRDATDGGINFGADTRTATRNSTTQDLSWKLSWKANDHWSFKSDLQLIRAHTDDLDSTVATGIQMPKETVDLTGSVPKLNFDAADKAYLADPANYYWAFTQEHLDKSVATEKAWRGDVEYDFDDPILRNLRFGVRFTDRDAVTTNSVPGYNWAAITQTWQVGWDINHVAYLNDPRFSGNTYVHTFDNFFNKNIGVPSLVFPTPATAAGYPGSYQTLHTYHDILCAEQHGGDTSACPAWVPASFGTDPAGTNDQHERTQAAYTQLRFGFDDLRFPVDGNVGVRVVRTQAEAHGYTVLSATGPNVPAGATVGGVPIPSVANFSKAQTFDNTYTDVLPSLNLKMKGTNGWQYRFGYSMGITRPDFTQLQAYTTLNQSVTSHTVTAGSATNVVVDSINQSGSAAGNPMLKPTKSNQMDLTAEWYFNKSGSFTVAAFNKQLKDIIINQTASVPVLDAGGAVNNFAVTSPVNGAKGSANGLEVAFQQYFDKLPGWMSGFGVSANYTYVKSRTHLYSPLNQAYCSSSSGGADNIYLNLSGCDTNGVAFNNLPLANLSKNSFNLALLYDQGPLSARVAYSWRSKYLQAVNVNGTQGTDGTDTNPNSANFGQHTVAWGLPTWADAYGELDASVFYKVTEQFSVGLEGSNLTNSTYKQLMQQGIGMQGRAWFASGPRYTLQARYSF
ncbi:MAG TPA: TonB-dependent receptor [Burkholderiaceae bacterium]